MGSLVLSSAPTVKPLARSTILPGVASSVPSARKWWTNTPGYSYPYNTTTSEPMKTYAVTLAWNIRESDPQNDSQETAVILITAESEEEAEELAIAFCSHEEEPHEVFAIEYAEVVYKRYGKQRNGEYGDVGLVAAY